MLPVSKREIEALQGVLKENQRLLALIIKELNEQQSILTALTKLPNLDESKLPKAFDLLGIEYPEALATLLDQLKKRNEDLRESLESMGKK